MVFGVFPLYSIWDKSSCCTQWTLGWVVHGSCLGLASLFAGLDFYPLCAFDSGPPLPITCMCFGWGAKQCFFVLCLLLHCLFYFSLSNQTVSPHCFLLYFAQYFCKLTPRSKEKLLSWNVDTNIFDRADEMDRGVCRGQERIHCPTITWLWIWLWGEY